jgi:hypothetical protein
VFVSDLSGDQIEEGKAAKIRITFEDGRRQSVEIDATAEEAAELGRKGRQVARRGRKPKSAAWPNLKEQIALTDSPLLVTIPDEPETEEPEPTPGEEEEGITPPEPATLPEQPDVDVPEPERLRASY